MLIIVIEARLPNGNHLGVDCQCLDQFPPFGVAGASLVGVYSNRSQNIPAFSSQFYCGCRTVIAAHADIDDHLDASGTRSLQDNCRPLRKSFDIEVAMSVK